MNLSRHTIALVSTFVGALTLQSTAALAVTVPGTGAFPMPPTVDLSFPFPAGEAVFLLSGYSPSGGSSLHRDRNAAGKANDHFALDLTLEDHPRHGHGQPIVAPVGGTVVKAGWATSGWANYGQRVILEHDDAFDGHRYTSVYAHLDSIAVVEGQRVRKGESLGTLGASCQGQRSCGSFGTPHLHWVIHRDAAVGGSGTGGSYGGNAVVPEVIDGAENLQRGQVHISMNTGGSGGTPVRPPACQLIPGEGGVLDDDGPCFSKSGTPRFWHRETTGVGTGHFWTETFVGTTPDNTARFTVAVDVAGDYDVYASVPAGATATAVTASVRSRRGVEPAVFAQSTGAATTARRFVKIGRFPFVPEALGSVTLLDTVASSARANKRLVVDALAIVPAGAPAPTVDEPAPPAPTLPPLPAGPCTLAGTSLTVEEDGPCAVLAGPSQYWHLLSSGSGGRARFTYAIADTADDNAVTWTFQARGRVELLVQVPANATSRQARYRFGGTAVVVDQLAQAGRSVSLGLFDVDGSVSVRLGDNTGEPYTGVTTSKRLGFDALVVRSVDVQRQGADDPVVVVTDAGDKAAADEAAPDILDTVDVDGVDGVDPIVDGADVDDGTLPEAAGGCSSAPTSTNGTGLGLALVLAGLGVLGRRRRVVGR